MARKEQVQGFGDHVLHAPALLGGQALKLAAHVLREMHGDGLRAPPDRCRSLRTREWELLMEKVARVRLHPQPMLRCYAVRFRARSAFSSPPLPSAGSPRILHV